MYSADKIAKSGFIDTFFAEMDARVAFIERLYDEGRDHEAILLCCCYIDGVGNSLYPDDDGSHKNFVRVIREHGGSELLTLVHPGAIRGWIERQAGKKAAAALALLAPVPEGALMELQRPEDLVSALPAVGQPSTKKWLAERLWHGTLASILYTKFRVPAVHRLGAPGGISFELTGFRSEMIPVLDFDTLYPVLRRVVAAARDISLKSGRWFGHT